MSRPRKPFGTDQPGRLSATMLKVLAAEMSDPGRLSRGKRYWTDDAVIDLVVGHGAATAEVQGSRPLPYVVTIASRPGPRAPSRSDVTVRCTCPDDDGAGRWACKHAVAAMFALADEVAIDPEVLTRWRAGEVDPDRDAGDDDGPAGRVAGSSAAVADRSLGRNRHELDDLLMVPGGHTLPDIPLLSDAVHPRFPDRLVADVLDDAVAHLHIRWE